MTFPTCDILIFLKRNTNESFSHVITTVKGLIDKGKRALKNKWEICSNMVAKYKDYRLSSNFSNASIRLIWKFNTV